MDTKVMHAHNLHISICKCKHTSYISKNGKCNDFLAFSYNYEHYPFLKVLEKFAFTIIALMKYEIWAAKSRE